MYAHTHHGAVRIEWPDGGCYLKQYAILVAVWSIIKDEIRAAQNEQRN